MIKFLHTGDLHLKAPPHEESDYSLQCLKILIKKANDLNVDAVLFCGDIFDSKNDYSIESFIESINRVCSEANMPIYYIPGNHEDIKGEYAKLKTVTFCEKIKLFPEVGIINHDDIEILAIPHMESYKNFSSWRVPDKQAKHRIAIAHGEIPGFSFDCGEDEASVLNSIIFKNYEVDNVFLGHIHKRAHQRIDNIEFYYAGSPRPVRRKEDGGRTLNIISIDQNVRVEQISLPETGEVRTVISNVLEHDWDTTIVELCASFNSQDRIMIDLTGFVEDPDTLNIKKENLASNLRKRFRRVNVKTENLEPLDNLLENEFFKKVYELWLTKKPLDIKSRDYKVWLGMLPALRNIREKVI